MTIRPSKTFIQWLQTIAIIAGLLSPVMAYFVSVRVASAQAQYEINELKTTDAEQKQTVKEINERLRNVELDVREVLTVVKKR